LLLDKLLLLVDQDLTMQLHTVCKLSIESCVYHHKLYLFCDYWDF